MNKTKYSLLLLSLLAAAMGVTGCNDDSKYKYDSNYQEKADKMAFATNFEKEYGKVDPNQSWDLANPNAVCMMPAAPLQVQTRAKEEATKIEVRKSEEFKISPEFTEAMNGAFNDFGNAEPCHFTFPADGLTIVPIFQGENKTNFDLRMVVGKENIKILGSNEGINVKQGKAKSFTIKGVPAGTPVSFYIASNGQQGMDNFSTLEGGFKLVDIDATSTGKYEEGTTIRQNSSVLACQCKGKNGTIKLAFLMDGLSAEQKHQAPSTITKVVSRRYMIEDLGSTDDFDFNDIVMDVKSTVTVENGIESPAVQTATLRHLGGTLSWNIKIGDTWFSGSEDEMIQNSMNSNPEITKDVSGWNPDTHNILVKVKGQQSENVYIIPFPKVGEVPMVIAEDTYQPWMDERQHIPSSWWTTE